MGWFDRVIQGGKPLRTTPFAGGVPAAWEDPNRVVAPGEEPDPDDEGSAPVRPLTAAEVAAQADVFIMAGSRLHGGPVPDEVQTSLRSAAFLRMREWSARRPWVAVICLGIALWKGKSNGAGK